MADQKYVEAVYYKGKWYAYQDAVERNNTAVLNAAKQNGTSYKPVDEVYSQNTFWTNTLKYKNSKNYVRQLNDGTIVDEIPEDVVAESVDKDVTSKDYINSLIEDAYKNYANLNVDPNSAQSQQYMNDMYAAIDREQSEVEAALSNAELDAYRQIGYQQQELENQIAENRLKALKSGTTSAQLAAQQLNNMFAAQAGASQIAANAMNARVGNAQDYASQRAAVTGGLYDQIAQNKTTLATAGAQNAAAGLSYASYVNQQLANLQANKALYKDDPKTYSGIFK